jgi:hypothetical protein
MFEKMFLSSGIRINFPVVNTPGDSNVNSRNIGKNLKLFSGMSVRARRRGLMKKNTEPENL